MRRWVVRAVNIKVDQLVQDNHVRPAAGLRYEVAASAVTAVGMAVTHVAGNPSGVDGQRWPILRIKTQLERELDRMLRCESSCGDWSLDQASQFPDPMSGSVVVELGRLLADAINAGVVKTREAQILWLTEAGYTDAEVGAAWSLSPSSIRKNNSRTRVSLRRVAG